jgi:hypothetical protein
MTKNIGFLRKSPFYGLFCNFWFLAFNCKDFQTFVESFLSTFFFKTLRLTAPKIKMKREKDYYLLYMYFVNLLRYSPFYLELLNVVLMFVNRSEELKEYTYKGKLARKSASSW